jgi:hypothetical protein
MSAAAAGGRLLRTGVRRLFGRTATGADSRPAERDFSRDGGYLPWLADRLKRTTAAVIAPRVRRQASSYRSVRTWCSGAASRG